MLNMLQGYRGSVEINGKKYDSVESARIDFKTFQGRVCIKLLPKQLEAKSDASNAIQNVDKPVEYRVTVRKYMTEKSSPSFDFMQKWNNNNPMPLRTMTGVILQETRGMVKMRLHGDIWAKKISTCMCCGRQLTNPVSQYFGIGPECGGHNYVNPFDSEDELREAVSAYKKKLQATVWEGWIIKSAITEQEEVTT